MGEWIDTTGRDPEWAADGVRTWHRLVDRACPWDLGDRFEHCLVVIDDPDLASRGVIWSAELCDRAGDNTPGDGYAPTVDAAKAAAEAWLDSQPNTGSSDPAPPSPRPMSYSERMAGRRIDP